MPRPKESFRIPLEDDKFLSISVFQTRNDPEAEVIVAQISQIVEAEWKNVARLAVYRSPEGDYRQLPEREKRK
jgi:hypothetical protein